MFTVVFMLFLLLTAVAHNDDVPAASPNLQPTVMVAFFARNKAHTLPYFLHYFERLDYPKSRMSLWIRADHNVDKSVEILESWLDKNEDSYHWVDYVSENNAEGYSDEKGPCDWSQKRFQHIINLRQNALNAARRVWADYVMFVDVDNFLKNPQVLNDLIMQNKTVVAPMLNCTASEHYSNFWGDMDELGYYKRSEDYKSIQLGHKLGCFPVALVHSTLLIDLRRKQSQFLAYYPPPPRYRGPFDDIIIFGKNAAYYDIPLHILNADFYGYTLIPMESENTLLHEQLQFLHLRVENIIYDTPLESLPYVEIPRNPPQTLGFDQIYVINLERRPDRRSKMQLCLEELGLTAQVFSAVDGKQLNDSYISKLGIKMLPEFADPYHGRAMTMGEIGCFLSHYFIWNDVVENNYDRILILEDDIRFELYFKENLQHLMMELDRLEGSWDLVYLGRKRLNHDKETMLEGSERLMWPDYSYWTLSYMLSQRGAQKLLAQQPLSKIVPVDEYLPIMFDRHPEASWMKHFSPRDLVTLSAQPLLVYPTHYTGEPGYFTDTENSEIISDTLKGRPSTDPNTLPEGVDPITNMKGDLNDITSSRDEL